MSFWTPPPEPRTKLGRHRQLSPLAGIHVSPIILGGGTIGYKWAKPGVGEMTRESSFKLLDVYYEASGNFIDAANNYDDGASEELVGGWMEGRGVRDRTVIVTKYTTIYKRDQPIQQRTHYTGINMKSLYVSLENSLKNLRIPYVDIPYVNWWDSNTRVEEVMNGLHHLVAARAAEGVIPRHLGYPSVDRVNANRYVKLTGKTPFSIYQGGWSILQRDFKTDIIPMARQLRAGGLALASWNVLA
ncbi:Aldo/keto reductase [Obba rivulosa]|uniref:Aldo/keto reductase n=1 Tax=Obba rivulosa TaxID=1052685 RepID=A0A8E2DKM1_9APHY|nr:Aldo/keto reductase [Obba rivulosa]